MANPPDDDNVLFYSGFNGTNDSTALAAGEFIGVTPTLFGDAIIKNDDGVSSFPYVGNAVGTSCRWNTDPVSGTGGVDLTSITGSSLIGGGQFYIEMIFRNTGGQNDVFIGVGFGVAGEQMFRLQFNNSGLLEFAASTDGTNYGASQTVSAFNNNRNRFVAIQYVSGRVGIWYHDGFNPCSAFTATKVVDYTPGTLHSSTENLRFGISAIDTRGAPGYQNWTYVAQEALYTDFPDSFVFPGCSGNLFPRNLACSAVLVRPIPDITLFIDETYSKDYSLYFKSPAGGDMTFSATNLPTGLTIDEDTGVISGAITNAESEGSTHSIEITAAISGCGSATDTFIITVGTAVANGGESFTTIHSAS